MVSVMEGVSEELKTAMEEIKAVAKKYDINGCIFLADGLKNGEFALLHDQPSWSQLEFIPKEDGSVDVKVKVRMKTNPENTNRTINSIYNLQGMMSNCWLMNDGIIKTMEKEIDIDHEPGGLVSHKEYLDNKDKN